jgi:hypothetical protein
MSKLNSMTKKAVITVIALFALSLLTASLAQATELTFQVTNSKGVTQSGVEVLHYSNTLNGEKSKYYYTDVNGRLTVRGTIIVGDKFVFSRDIKGSSPTTPENSLSQPIGRDHGLSYTFSNQDLPIKEIVLPTLNNNSLNPDLKIIPQVRLLVGLINQLRSSQGLNKLPISTLLTNSAQNFADLLTKENVPFNKNNEAHNYNSISSARAIDLGFPAFCDLNIGLNYSGGVVENIYFGNNIQGAFTGWLNSPGHKRAMIYSTADTIGIGYTENKVVAMFADIDQSNSIVVQKAQLTDDYGDPNIKIDSEGKPDNKGNSAHISRKYNPRLSLRLRPVGRKWLKIVIRRASKARGKVAVKINSRLVRISKAKRIVLVKRKSRKMRIQVRFFAGNKKFKNRTIVRVKRFR